MQSALTLNHPNIIPQYSYTTRQACKALSTNRRRIHRTTLWRYVQKGLLVEHRSSNNRPYYLGKDLLNLWTHLINVQYLSIPLSEL